MLFRSHRQCPGHFFGGNQLARRDNAHPLGQAVPGPGFHYQGQRLGDGQADILRQRGRGRAGAALAAVDDGGFAVPGVGTIVLLHLGRDHEHSHFSSPVTNL